MPTPSLPSPVDRVFPRRLKFFLAGAVVLVILFIRPLHVLLDFAWHDEFFSYIPLIPAISIYLIWIKRSGLPKIGSVSVIGPFFLALAGLLAWNASSALYPPPSHAGVEDYLTLSMAGLVMLLTALAWVSFGHALTRAIRFPLFFLIFMVPMPSSLLGVTESFFQTTSAVTASGMLSAAGMPVLRENLLLHLPGISILIAPECSGIHSTMVLLITSALAGYLFLETGWKRLVLVALVIPLAIVRNGFRIFVVSELCVRISHDMIDSPIHRRGGPIFFALSLIPFFAILFWLRKSEGGRRTARAGNVIGKHDEKILSDHN